MRLVHASSWKLLKLLCDVVTIGLRFFQREKVSISFFPSLDDKVCEGMDVLHVAIPGKYYLQHIIGVQWIVLSKRMRTDQ